MFGKRIMCLLRIKLLISIRIINFRRIVVVGWNWNWTFTYVIDLNYIKMKIFLFSIGLKHVAKTCATQIALYLWDLTKSRDICDFAYALQIEFTIWDPYKIARSARFCHPNLQCRLSSTIWDPTKSRDQRDFAILICGADCVQPLRSYKIAR